MTLQTLVTLQTIYAQVSQQWAARYHFISEDIANDIAVDDLGNVYVTGESAASSGYKDYATIKYNSSGVQQWVQRYNGPGNNTDEARSIAVDKIGNVYVTGVSNRAGFPGQDDYDFATIKYNVSGVQQWIRRYNGGGSDGAGWIEIDNQGFIYVGGGSDGFGADYLVIKYNSNGDSLWVRRYDSGGNDNGYDYAIAMAVDTAGNVYLTGSVGLNSFPAPDWATVKWNAQGVLQWVQRYNGPGSGSDYPKDIAVDNSGNVYVTGYVWGNNNTDYATIKYNTNGVQQWVTFYNSGFNDKAESINFDDSGNVYVTGWSGGANVDYLTIKYSLNGIQQWTARFNGPANSSDFPCCIKLDTQGNVYVTGYATVSLSPVNYDYCTIKYSNSGAQIWVIYYGVGPPQAPGDIARALEVDQSGDVYVTGYSFGDYATIKYSQTVGITPISNEIPNEYKLEQNYPNPFNPITNIKFQMPKEAFVKLTVFDVLGREVATLVNEQLKPGSYEVDFDGSYYPSGVYFYTLKTAGYVETKKMILNK